MTGDDRLNRRMLDLAARVALRGAGRVEPNPMVGCVIGDADGTIRGIGHHRVFGGPHAEVEAIASCRANGRDPRGGTAWVTLEPCSHHGKTPPCTEALIRAGVARVVVAQRDTHAVSAGGIERLRASGIEVIESGVSAGAIELSAPFRKRVGDALPFVTLKWAQSIDGRIATRTGDSQWISCARSRRRVHRMRAVSDVVLTGIGTVLADDPLLTARGVPVRRVAARIVMDRELRIPLESALVSSADRGPVIIATTHEMAGSDRASALRARGVEVRGVNTEAGRLDPREVLSGFGGAMHVLVEAGPGLIGGLLRADLADRCVVFIAPMLIGDDAAPGPALIGPSSTVALATRFELIDQRRCGDDAMLTYRKRAGE